MREKPTKCEQILIFKSKTAYQQAIFDYFFNNVFFQL